MSGFIRVRAVNGPKHEFHAAADEVRVHPELYRVIDKTVVDRPEPPTYILPDSAEKKPVGDPKKENN